MMRDRGTNGMAESLRGVGGWRRPSSVVGLAVVLVVITACSPLNLDWQSRLFDSGHGSATTDNVLTATDVGALTTKWRLTPPACPGGASGGAWYATPVTFKGVIYVGSARGASSRSTRRPVP